MQEADECFKKAVEMKPDTAEARFSWLWQVYLRQEIPDVRTIRDGSERV